ncbi:hypothetical protein B9Z55_015460 [Caenorhabditis nigoni]|uniref:BHLH domain-containing protein n=1 Tax=Caenorhabditis nigoni TaxID=1611254 RepID=A0A2G5UAD3_9PELO|nr:hypothetical protein B9Z55_015460 [Caenorhabditis nigoni]
MVRSNKSKNHKDPRMEPTKRLRANMRERRRVSQMNEMFDILISLLPPSEFRLRLSRAQALREAAKYINQLVEHLETSDGSDDITKFPHIFLEERQSKTLNYRTPVNSSSVTAFMHFTAFMLLHLCYTICQF